jgi:hypothetical protein
MARVEEDELTPIGPPPPFLRLGLSNFLQFWRLSMNRGLCGTEARCSVSTRPCHVTCPPLPTSLMMAAGVRDNGEGGDDGVDIAGGQDIEGNGSRNQIDIIIFVDISS